MTDPSSNIIYFAGHTNSGHVYHAVPNDAGLVQAGWVTSLCGNKILVPSLTDAWDFDRVEIRQQCINCRVKITGNGRW